MMSPETAPHLEQIGLPLPTEEEGVLLQKALGESQLAGQLSVESMAKKVINLTLVSHVIEHDVQMFTNYDAEDLFLSAEQVIEFCEGIEQGYEFIIGSISYIHYLRTAYKTFSDYAKSAGCIPGHLPAFTIGEKRRIKQVRFGGPAIDRWVYGDMVQNSSQLAEAIERSYFAASKCMEDLLRKECIRIENSGDGINNLGSEDTDQEVAITDPMVGGFKQGTRNALMMYVQSKEESILSSLEFQTE